MSSDMPSLALTKMEPLNVVMMVREHLFLCKHTMGILKFNLHQSEFVFKN
jgi:hypothetical protein